MSVQFNFQSKDRVELHSLGGDELEGKSGKIVGLASVHRGVFPTVFYLVELDEPYEENGFGTCNVITMIEHCLRKQVKM